MAQNEKGQKKVHRCPPHPYGPENKFTGPGLERGDSLSVARTKWGAYLRKVSQLRPTPRTTR